MLKKTLLACLMLIMSVTAVTVASAQEPAPNNDVTQDEVNEIASGLYCPVCENVPLDVCPTQACEDWRAEIRTMLARGEDEAAIQAYFVTRYGQRVLATPEAQGFDLFVWLVPLLGVGVGAGILFFSLRKMAPSAIEATAGSLMFEYRDLDPDYVEQLERELAEFKQQSTGA